MKNHCTNIGNIKYNHLKSPEEERNHWCSNTPRTGRSRKTSAVNDRNIVKAVVYDPKTTVRDISNTLALQSERVNASQSTVRRRLHEQKYRGYTRRCKPLITKKKTTWASKVLGQGFIDWWDNLYQSDGKANVYKLIWNTLEVMSWLGLASLLLGQAH